MAADYAALKKGGWMRQKQKDRFALRVHVTGGHLTEKQMIGISKVAEKYGHGYVHLTARQSLEIPWIALDDIEDVKRELAEYDVHPSACGPRVRTTTACQGNATCPSACVDTYSLAQEIDERYFAKELPGKFKFGITGCLNNCLKTEENDVGIKGAERVEWIEESCIQCGVCVKACREGAVALESDKIVIDRDKCVYCGRCAKSCPMDAYEEHPGYMVSFGGMFGNHFHRGRQLTPFVQNHDKLIQLCDAAITFFNDHGQPGDRLQFAIERYGQDDFDKLIRDVYATSEEEAREQASKPLELTDWKLRDDIINK